MRDGKKVPAIITISHGYFCKALNESAEMIYGAVDGLEALPLEEGMDAETYEKKLKELIDKYEGNVFVLVDIIGGTPFNTLMKVSRTMRMYGLTNMNMPMLLEVLSARDDHSADEMAAVIEDTLSDVKMNICTMLEKVYGK